MKIAMCSIPVTDPIKAFQFYTKILNFKEHLYLPEYQLAIVISPEDLKGASLLLEPNDNSINKNYQEGAYNSSLPIIVFSTEDISQEYNRLKDLNVTFIKEPTKQDWGIEAIFDDSCGNYIQLVQIN
jgi:predicted enzyme related to lactoylglutathione lyase